MKIGNLKGRLALLMNDKAVDVAEASDGKFGAEPQAVWARWDEFRAWAKGANAAGGKAYAPEDLGVPTPRPGQVFAIGLNYRDHAAEAGLPIPDHPVTFCKFQSCLSAPYAPVTLPTENIDWEIELVAVIGREARNVSASDGWNYVAGLMVGQDVSERVIQMRPPVPQFNLSKSFAGFGPVGPWVTTLDEVPNPDDLALTCKVDGQVVQQSRTSQMIFPIPDVVARLSQIVTLWPGDILFTGTPPGVGIGRKPPRFLRAGEVLESTIEHLGTIRQKFVAKS